MHTLSTTKSNVPVALRRQALAMLPPVAAVAIQLALWRFVDPHVWFLFYPAVFISSWIGGRNAGLWATAISVTAVWWLFIPPRYSFATKYLTALFPAGVFVSTGVLFSLFHDRLRQSNQRAIEALRALRAANEEIRRLYEETKRSRDSLSEKEVRLRIFAALVDNSSDFIGIADTSGKPVYVNPAGRRMVGLSPDYPVEDTQIPDYYPPDLRAFVSNVIVKSMNEQGFWKGETCFRHWQTQEAIPVSDAHFTIREPETGRLLGLGTITRDITERRRTEEALSLSEAKFAGIFSVSADAIISVDEAQRITMFNEGARSIFGYSKDELVGSPLEVLIPNRFRSIHRGHVERFLEGQETARRMGSRSAKIYGLRKNGEEFPIDAAISKLRVGGTALLIVSIRDISERVRIEDEQRLLAETGDILVSAGSDYQRLLTDIANVVVRNIADWCAVDIVQAGEVRRLKIVHSDPAKAEICKALESHPIDRQRPNLISEAIDTKRPILVSDPPPGYLESLAQSEEHLQLLRVFDPGSFIVVPLIARGHSLGTLAFGSSRSSRRYSSRDVREAEQLASRVALAVDNARLHEALERAIQARDDVLGIVAHDLRSPLNTIVLQAHTLARRRDASDDRHQRVSESIRGAATNMNRLIQDLLDVTRIEAGQRLAVNPETVPTQSLLAEAIDQQQTAISACRRELRLDAAGAPPSVWADHTRVLQVFDNLLGNAMKFSRARITVGACIKDREALFWVADDGPGICAEDLPRLFDRFWQASKADRRGAGLGLSIVKGIVEAHGGRIWVESAVGAGTTFYFTMPMAPSSAR